MPQTFGSMTMDTSLTYDPMDDPDDDYEEEEQQEEYHSWPDAAEIPMVTSKLCFGCGKSDVAVAGHHSSTLTFNGKLTRSFICGPCYEALTEGKLYYCLECEDFYVAPIDWCPIASFSTVVCPKHSLLKTKPKSKCSSCSVTGFKFFNNNRSVRFCENCWFNSITCHASYCQAVIHIKQKGVVHTTKKKKWYCEDCALVPTLPTIRPNVYHPLTWDYDVLCWCSVCTYLSGKAPQWPSVIKPGPDSHCSSCKTEVHSATLYKPKGTQATYCHVCATMLKECPKCKTKRVPEQFHLAPTGSDMPLYKACDFCIGDNTNFWLCEATCKSWIPSGVDCDCGGVLPYNYVPKVKIFMSADSQQRVKEALQDKTPFLGLELEMEAHHSPANRINGAKILNRIASDYGYVVHDGTLLGTDEGGLGGQRGFEFVTHPFTYEWFNDNWSRIEKMLNTMGNAGFRSWEGGRCGIHVHISRGPMSDAHQMKFIRFIYGSVNMVMCIGQRGYKDKILNEFAPFHKENRYNFIQKIRDYINPDVHGHYAALNCNKKATLEGRWFRGTLNPLGVRKNVEFMHSLWHFTKMYGFSSANEINYIDWLRQTPQSKDYAVLLNFLEREYVTRR